VVASSVWRRVSFVLLSIEAIILVFPTFLGAMLLLGASGQALSGGNLLDVLAWLGMLMALVSAWWLLLAYFYGGSQAARRVPQAVWLFAALIALFALLDVAGIASSTVMPLAPAILFVPTFVHLSIEVWGLPGMQEKAAEPRGRRWLGSAVLVVVLCLISLGAFQYWRTRPLPFDRAVWDAKAESLKDFRRHRMADRLVGQRQLIGLSRAEVISMLGEPTVTARFRDYDLVYVLGNERSWVSIDSEWLVMRLDGAGKVSEALLVRD